MSAMMASVANPPDKPLARVRRIAVSIDSLRAELRLAALDAVQSGESHGAVADAADMSREWVRRLILAANQAVTPTASPASEREPEAPEGAHPDPTSGPSPDRPQQRGG